MNKDKKIKKLKKKIKLLKKGNKIDQNSLAEAFDRIDKLEANHAN